MTEKKIEEKANKIRKNEKDRLQFCKDVGITEDDFFVNQNGDFEIEDMVRAFERGKQSRVCDCMTYLTFKDLEKECEKLEKRVQKQSDELYNRNAETNFYKENNTRHYEQLEKSVTILKKFMLWENDWHEKTESKYELLKETENFLKEITK